MSADVSFRNPPSNQKNNWTMNVTPGQIFFILMVERERHVIPNFCEPAPIYLSEKKNQTDVYSNKNE